MTRRASCPECSATLKQTADLEHQPRQERQAGGAPVGPIATAVVIAAMLGLAAGGGVVYLYSKPVVSPVVVQAPPTHSDAAHGGTERQNERDRAVVAQQHDLERVPDGQAPQKRPDPPFLALRHDLERAPDGPPPQEQHDPQPAHPGDGRIPQEPAAIAPPAQHPRWQYVVIPLPADNNRATERLNSLADEGWEYLGLISTALPLRACGITRTNNPLR
jgi:hypothetical protein